MWSAGGSDRLSDFGTWLDSGRRSLFEGLEFPRSTTVLGAIEPNWRR